jgi:Smg protein
LFDVLVYLFESYVHAGACPASDQLARKLSAAGFEDDEISDALEWLNGLRDMTDPGTPAITPANGSMRIYADAEMTRLNAECRGFLMFLENAGALDTATRELIIDRAMALERFNLHLDRFKVIVLMVLWQREQPLDGLILDELLEHEEYEPVFQ